MVNFTILGHFGGPLGRQALTWGLPRRLHMVPNFSLLAHTRFLYNWIIYRHKSSYKCRKISCSVKIILKTSFLSDFDPFMGFQQSLYTRKAKYCLQIYHRIINSNFLKTWSLFLNFFHFFIIFSVFQILVISRPFVDPPDPWGTQTFWLWSWIYPRSPWDVSQLQKTASWQLFSMSIVQKPWYGHFHYFGAFWGASREAGSHVGGT